MITGDIRAEPITKQFGKEAHHMIVEAFTGTGVTAAPIRKYQDYNIRKKGSG